MLLSFVWEFHYVIQATLLHVLTTQTGKFPVTMWKINSYFQNVDVLLTVNLSIFLATDQINAQIIVL